MQAADKSDTVKRTSIFVMRAGIAGQKILSRTCFESASVPFGGKIRRRRNDHDALYIVPIHLGAEAMQTSKRLYLTC